MKTGRGKPKKKKYIKKNKNSPVPLHPQRQNTELNLKGFAVKIQ
jgi:hypothetical protein